MSRRAEVARICGVPESSVQPVTERELRLHLTDRVSATVLEVATAEPAYFWRVGNDFYYDDALFGPVTNFADLDYDADLGLHVS